MFKKFCCLFMALSVLNLSVFAGAPLRRGTPVYVRTMNEVSSKTKPTTMNAIVDSDVKTADGVIAISRGTNVIVTLDSKKPKGVGKAGSITVKSMTTQTVDGQTIFLNGSLTEEGQNKMGKALGLGLGLGLLVFLPFLAFIAKKGGDAVIPAGTVLTQFSTADEYQINK